MPHFIPIESISVPENRQRREFDAAALEELRTSIQETPYGLQHPLVVRQGPDGRVLLVAGERRLRALRDVYALGGTFRHAGKVVPAGQVPVVDLGELDPIDAFAAELEENVRRTDLTVIELAKATAALYSLRAQQAERDGRPAPSASDLAKEVFDIPDSKPKGEYGQATNTIREQVMVARHAEDADVAKATSLREAVKIIKKKQEAKQNAALAAAVGETYTTDKLFLWNKDAKDWLAGCPSAAFQIILTDPPYGMGANEFGDSGQGVAADAHFYDDSYESWQAMLEWFAPESYRVAAADAHLYAFCHVENFVEFREKMRAAGWNVFRTPLTWVNPDGFRAPWPEHGPQRKTEWILYARKGDKKCATLRGDALEYRKDTALGHPAQKPVNLLVDLLKRSAAPGDAVLDPFAGSGATLEAAHTLKLTATAIERDTAAYGIALKRLKSLAAHDPALF